MPAQSVTALMMAQKAAQAKTAAAAAAKTAAQTAQQKAIAALGPLTNLDFPPGYVNKRTPIDPFDKSPEAQFYGQLDKVATFIATHAIASAQDTIDRNGNNHVNGPAKAKTIAAIARAINLYMLNFPLSDVKAIGWKAMLTKILGMPLATWSVSKGLFVATDANNVPLPWQVNDAATWRMHPAYFAFWFWGDDLSFYQFLRYDKVNGFVFTDVFRQIVQQAFLASWWGPKQAIRIQDWISYRWGGVGSHNGAALLAAAVGDQLYSVNAKSHWLYDALAMPATYTTKLQTAANDIYSQQGHAQLMGYLSDAALIASIAFAGSALLASGLTWTTGLQAASVLENSPIGIQSNALKDVLILGKAVNLPALVGSMSLDMSAAPELQPDVPLTVAGPSLASIGAPAVSIDSTSFDPSVVDIPTADLSAAIDPSTIVDPSSTLNTADAINANVVSFSAPDMTITPPDLPVIDPTTGADLSALPQTPVDITPQDPSTVLASDHVTFGVDPAAVDNAQADAVTAATDTSGNFNLANYVGIIAKVYAAVSAAGAAGTAPAHVANRPTPGTVTHLPDGSTAVTNTDGTTTVTSKTGSVYTVMPSGKVVNGPVGTQNSMLLYGLLGLGALAAVMLTNRKR